MATSGHRPLLACEGLGVSYLTRAGEIPAVVGFDLAIAPGEAVGLVGESGCGKSTVALAVMRYLGRSGRIVAGSIRFDGRELTTMSERELRRIRGSRISMVYQEPMASLNPSMTVGRQLVEVP
ncbi:MAG TPA: ABC transporter ATP-binding protein, partial [Rhodospirillales bacterium]|nr:ABC transporter ATP-binding protein [Rhodospirillales bacterium]